MKLIKIVRGDIVKSEEYKNQLKNTLEQMIDTLDDTYYSMRAELEDEILQRKENIMKIDEETKKIYSILTDELCEKLIKIKPPLRVKLFNKIKWGGKSIESPGYIKVHFYFNDNHNYFSCEFSTKEIKELLKIKDGEL